MLEGGVQWVCCESLHEGVLVKTKLLLFERNPYVSAANDVVKQLDAQ